MRTRQAGLGCHLLRHLLCHLLRRRPPAQRHFGGGDGFGVDALAGRRASFALPVLGEMGLRVLERADPMLQVVVPEPVALDGILASS